MLYTTMNSPCGQLLLAGDERGLNRIHFQEGRQAWVPSPDWRPDKDFFRQTRQQLEAYFNRELKEFKLPLAPQGTPFQSRVWQKLLEIPYGQVITYRTLAERMGNIKACRAVGAANGQNPISIVIPCHRVIGTNGSLTGFGGGLPNKKRLLAMEGAVLS